MVEFALGHVLVTNEGLVWDAAVFELHQHQLFVTGVKRAGGITMIFCINALFFKCSLDVMHDNWGL